MKNPTLHISKYEGKVLPGKPYPLGANYDGEGVNFALFSENATGVKLCLFHNAEDPHEYTQIDFEEVTDYVWHAYLPGLKPGQLYGYRVTDVISLKRVFGLIRKSCCSTPTQRQLPEESGLARVCLITF